MFKLCIDALRLFGYQFSLDTLYGLSYHFRHKSQLSGAGECSVAVNSWCKTTVGIEQWNDNGIHAFCTSISLTSDSISNGMWQQREMHPARQLSWFPGWEEYLAKLDQEKQGMERSTSGAERASVRQENQRSLLSQYREARQGLQNKERGGRNLPVGAKLQRLWSPNMGFNGINYLWLPDMLPWLGDTRPPSSTIPIKWCGHQNSPKSARGRSLWAGGQCSVCLRREGGERRPVPFHGLAGLDVEADTESIELLWRGSHHIKTCSHSCPLLQYRHWKGLGVWGASLPHDENQQFNILPLDWSMEDALGTARRMDGHCAFLGVWSNLSSYDFLQAVDVRVGLVDLTQREKPENSAKIVDVKVLLISIIHPRSE